MTSTNQEPISHDWQDAGEAWGRAANDWACLYEHYAFEVISAIFTRIGVGPGVELLDIACGSGLAIRHAASVGATTAGIDASAPLVAIGRRRNPQSDLRHGSMFELPWPDQRFDLAISINGIWGGCGPALAEARRVLRPGGLLGISFWGPGPPNDLRGCFKTIARHSPPDHFGSMKRIASIGAPGVAEEMLTSNGFEVLDRGSRVSTLEWPDAELAWRAVSSAGPVVPALRHGDIDQLRRDVLAAIDHCRDEAGVYRFRNDHHFVIARAGLL